jgi:phage repressor protein C with HTH and peptisase S24 domain
MTTTKTKTKTPPPFLTTADLIRIHRERVGVSQSELGRRLGLSPQAVQHWERGKTRPRAQSLEDLAAALGVTPRDLISGASPDVPDVADRPDRVARHFAPANQVPTSLRVGSVAAIPRDGRVWMRPHEQQQGVVFMAVTAAWAASNIPEAKNPDALRLVEVATDAMSPTLVKGDILVIDTGITSIKQEAIYAIQDDLGEFFVRRVQRLPGGALSLLPDNPSYRPVEVQADEAESLTIVGRAVMAWNARRL